MDFNCGGTNVQLLFMDECNLTAVDLLFHQSVNFIFKGMMVAVLPGLITYIVTII